MRDLGVERIDLKTVARDVDFALLRLIDLARALASDPHILMLDEITAALPADLSERVFKVVRDFRSRGASVIFISHRMAEIAMLCDRATVLRDGVTVGVTPTKGAEETIVNLMLGSDVAKATTRRQSRARPAPRRRRRRPALEVRRPELWPCAAAASPSGSIAAKCSASRRSEGQGQEELFDCIAGVRRADAGEVRAEGRVLKLRHPADAIRAGLVLVPANRLVSLLPQRSVQENVALAAFGRLRTWGPIAMGEERRRVDMAVRKLQIDTRAAAEVQPPQRRQHAEGRHRALDRRRLQDPALLRPDARHRHRHQAADLCAHARDRRSGRCPFSCSPPNCRRFASPAIGRSSCSAAASPAKCRRRKPTKRASCGPRTG